MTENIIYDVDYFITKFEAIPEDKWNTGTFVKYLVPDCRCAFGHCDMKDWNSTTEEAKALSVIFGHDKDEDINHDNNVIITNDGSFGAGAKQRILNKLKQIKNAKEIQA